LRNVIFESGASLRTMISKGDADLSWSFIIEIANCDCELDFEGFEVGDRRNIDGSIYLLKKGSFGPTSDESTKYS
jgi:hypothetical protein